MRINSTGDSADKQGIQGAALIRLLTWMSPAFPLGAFSYSHGLETAISEGSITDRATTLAWLEDLLVQGGGWSDAVLMALSWNAEETEQLIELNAYALAMAPASERYLETTQQGNAFLKASKTWPVPLHDALDKSATGEIALPVILGAMAKQHAITLDVILPAFLHAFVANLTSAAMRLVPLGQSDGLAIQAALEPVILTCAQHAQTADLSDIGTCCLMSDIAAMQHETLSTRIFRS